MTGTEASEDWAREHWRLRGRNWAITKATDDQLEWIAALARDPAFINGSYDSDECRMFDALVRTTKGDTESQRANHADAMELAEFLYGDNHFDDWPSDEETRWIIEGIIEVWDSRRGG